MVQRLKKIKDGPMLRWFARISQPVGVLGTAACIIAVIVQPSWPTPDKLLVFMTCVAMIFGKSKDLLKRFVPFVGLLLVYESMRGFAPMLNRRVEFVWMIEADKFLGFGRLPTNILQDLLWNWEVTWLERLLTFSYMLHFVLPLALALLIWKYRPLQYWRYVATFLVVSFAGFLTFLAMPAAPPWMASRDGYIQIEHISSWTWGSLGIKDFPTLYKAISPNPVAAVPSLHAAYATLIALFAWKSFGRKWGLLASIYPLLIYFGTVYMGEHYLIDEFIGSAYAFAAYAFIRSGWLHRFQFIRAIRKRLV